MDAIDSLNLFDSVDIECARKCTADSSARLLIAALSQATRQGHLCLEAGETLIPSTKQLFGQTHPELEREIKQIASKDHALSYIHRQSNRFYFEKYWAYESLFETHFYRLAGKSPGFSLNNSQVDDYLRQVPNLLPEQKKAVKIACSQTLSIISGGPGTGKTFTAGVLIEALWRGFSPEQKKEVRFALAAPTGKAALHLQKSFQRIADMLEGFPPLQAETLHSLLGVSHGQQKGRPVLADVVIIDESSMIDVKMMALLLESVKEGARLVFLGDSHQLPPVEAGSLFTDMIALLPEVGKLTHCLRVEMEAIRKFADAVYRGDSASVLAQLNQPEEGVRRLKFASETLYSLREGIAEHVIHERPSLPDITYARVKQFLDAYCLLSPLRQGYLGVDSLNQLIYDRLKSNPIHPILITKNDRKQELYNGDTGILVEGEIAYFLGPDQTLRKVPALLLPPYEYAYCLSVHKSQGSEFQHVLLLLPDGSERFGREGVYTGITRAKKQVDIWGADATIASILANKSYRHSGLKKPLP